MAARRQRQVWLVVSALCAALGVGCESETGKRSVVHGDECASCHADEAALTMSPPHIEANFGSDCESCHGQEQWRPAQYVHTMAFPLTGGHADVTCLACHSDGYAPGTIPNQCVDCHQANAAMVVSPIHAGLSPTCSACHRTDAFKPTTFVHSWPLEGVHATLRCTGCHTGNPALYEGTSTACVDCHESDQASANLAVPGHENYGDNCQTCHGFDSF
jgi:hypothetical protein